MRCQLALLLLFEAGARISQEQPGKEEEAEAK